MKIDEVIESIEPVTNHDTCWFDEHRCIILASTLSDALHYLKAFRDAKDTLDTERDRYAEAVKNCEVAENKYRKLCKELRKTSAELRNDPDGDHQQLLKCQALLQDFYRNDPLDWETLTQMEGKPVWVEDSNGKGEWVLLSGTEDEYLYFVYRDCVEYKIYRDEQGKRWQAYRKKQP